MDDPRKPKGKRHPPPAPTADAATPPPWEEIEAGRYQPRRIRGSCRGRALG
jgi:hypothetical protein